MMGSGGHCMIAPDLDGKPLPIPDWSEARRSKGRRVSRFHHIDDGMCDPHQKAEGR